MATDHAPTQDRAVAERTATAARRRVRMSTVPMLLMRGMEDGQRGPLFPRPRSHRSAKSLVCVTAEQTLFAAAVTRRALARRSSLSTLAANVTVSGLRGLRGLRGRHPAQAHRATSLNRARAREPARVRRAMVPRALVSIARRKNGPRPTIAALDIGLPPSAHTAVNAQLRAQQVLPRFRLAPTERTASAKTRRHLCSR
jgi:hypothetical protein